MSCTWDLDTSTGPRGTSGARLADLLPHAVTVAVDLLTPTPFLRIMFLLTPPKPPVQKDPPASLIWRPHVTRDSSNSPVLLKHRGFPCFFLKKLVYPPCPATALHAADIVRHYPAFGLASDARSVQPPRCVWGARGTRGGWGLRRRRWVFLGLLLLRPAAEGRPMYAVQYKDIAVDGFVCDGPDKQGCTGQLELHKNLFHASFHTALFYLFICVLFIYLFFFWKLSPKAKFPM